MQTEREQFRDFRDLNKDGKLDGSEVGHWVRPPAQDQPLVEANHLLHESDTDKVRGGGPAALGDAQKRPKRGPGALGFLFAESKGDREFEMGREKRGDRDSERGRWRPGGHP